MSDEGFHPCPGSIDHGAWMNIILDEEDGIGTGYNKPVPIILQQYELHNVIVLLWGAANQHSDIPGMTTKQVIMNLARKLDAAWKRSLGRNIPDGTHRRR